MRVCMREGCGASLAGYRSDARWCSLKCQGEAKALRARERALTRASVAQAARSRSGPQVSLRKAARVLAREAGLDLEIAEWCMTDALPDRQYAQLLERHPTRKDTA